MAKPATAAYYSEMDRPKMEIVTPEGVVLPFINASFGERLGALLIDLLIMVALPIVVFIILISLPHPEGAAAAAKAAKSAPGGKVAQSILEIAFLAFLFFIRSGYFMAFEMGARAATPGKRLLRLRVIAHDGGRLTPAAVFTRNALREVELYLPLGVMVTSLAAGNAWGWLGLLWAVALLLLPLFNKQHARLGDYLAGTRVVHMPKAALSYDLADFEGDRKRGVSFTPDQLAYGEMELGVLEQVLRERKAEVMRAVAEKIKTRINWQAPKNPLDAPSDEDFLRAYYSALRAWLESRMLLGRRRKDKTEAALN